MFCKNVLRYAERVENLVNRKHRGNKIKGKAPKCVHYCFRTGSSRRWQVLRLSKYPVTDKIKGKVHCEPFPYIVIDIPYLHSQVFSSNNTDIPV